MATFILGPCCMETEENYKNSAKFLLNLMDGQDWYYKASFDKANRTSLSSPRGPGLEQGILWFKELKTELPKIRLITDIHESYQAERLAGIVDAIQIPAFLCRQTDLLIAAAKNFSVINIKKGQWVSPEQMIQALQKVKEINPTAEVWVTERGAFFGYDNLVVDFSIVSSLKTGFDKVILDCTHSTQRHKGTYTGGDKELAKKYLLSSPIFGYDGVFAEAHFNPAQAWSDKDSQIPLSELESLLAQYHQIAAIVNSETKCCCCGR